MAATIFSRNVVVGGNTTFLGKSAAKVAAGLLVLTTFPVTPAHDVQRVKQTKWFDETTSFISPMPKFRPAAMPIPYVLAKDVRRGSQAKIFSEPETFISPQRGFNNVTLSAYAVVAQQYSSTNAVLVEILTTIRPQRSFLTTLGAGPVAVLSGDIISGQDTYGWPPDAAEPPTFIAPQRANKVILNGFTAYNPATDVRRAMQGKWFSEPETFQKTQRWSFAAINTFPYNPNADVIWRRPQSKVWSEPEVFARTQPHPVGSPIFNFKPYVPGTDVRRAIQGKWFTDYDAFPPAFRWQAPFSQLLINGKVGTPPLLFARGLDVYDYLDGAILLAWGAFPLATSYNIYQRTVTFTPSYQPPPSAFSQSAQAVKASFGPWTLSAVTFLGPLNAMVSGLTIASYNTTTQVITPSITYDLKVAAVVNGVERGQVSKRVTPGPESDMLRTPMKRLWPFPQTGENDG